ncbi:hypothetical protein HDU93_001157 [Gonapodya sp. JEL0774]|nr:hypothetical protein HDU93_001157 [Gonapodya sp. JEL0774]
MSGIPPVREWENTNPYRSTMKSKLCKLRRVARVYDLYLTAGRIEDYESTFGGGKYTNWNKLYEAINKAFPKTTVSQSVVPAGAD